MSTSDSAEQTIVERVADLLLDSNAPWDWQDYADRDQWADEIAATIIDIAAREALEQAETKKWRETAKRYSHVVIPRWQARAEAAETENTRLREGLQKVAAVYSRNRWRPDRSWPSEHARDWHDGFISAAAEASIMAEKYLDPEAHAKFEEDWRAAHEGTDADWYERTGHCGHCGDVGDACSCEGTCGCSELHGPRKPDWVPDAVRLEAAETELAETRQRLAFALDALASAVVQRKS